MVKRKKKEKKKKGIKNTQQKAREINMIEEWT